MRKTVIALRFADKMRLVVRIDSENWLVCDLMDNVEILRDIFPGKSIWKWTVQQGWIAVQSMDGVEL